MELPATFFSFTYSVISTSVETSPNHNFVCFKEMFRQAQHDKFFIGILILFIKDYQSLSMTRIIYDFYYFTMPCSFHNIILRGYQKFRD